MNKEDEILQTLIEVKTVLLGKNGDDGLCGDVKRVTLIAERNKLHIWILTAILVGSGIITVGIANLIP